MTALADDRHVMGNGRLTATIATAGAELHSLQDTAGRGLLWNAGPAWPRHAPVLFPIVGRLRDDTLTVDGRSYRMTQHGFARDRRFTWTERAAEACRLVLSADAETRACYPFEFRLELSYALHGDALHVGYMITNTGDRVLPASLGAHPAFRWPLADGSAKTTHCLEFAAPEPAPIRRLEGGLMRDMPEPTPIENRHLPLNEALFADDAVILDHPVSRAVRYGAPGHGAIELSWDGFEQLGLWSKPGSDFLCIEPWHGFASPASFDGEFADKPGLMLIPAGDTRRLGWRVRLPIEEAESRSTR